MEKRFVLFLVLTVTVIFGHLAIVNMFRPPEPPVVEGEDAEPAVDQPAPVEEKPREDEVDIADAGPDSAPEVATPDELEPETEREPREFPDHPLERAASLHDFGNVSAADGKASRTASASTICSSCERPM